MNFNLIEGLQGYIEFPIFVACLIVGWLYSHYTSADNKHIPLLVTVVGVLASILAHWGEFNLHVLLIGAISGLSSTGFHQVFKQYIEKNKGE